MFETAVGHAPRGAAPARTRFVAKMPVTWPQLFRSKFDWDYLTEPQPELNGRRIYWPRGKALGGSSSLNAMMWVRGFVADSDEWAQHAGHEWKFSRVVEYFTRIEKLEGAREPDEGPIGPLYISRQRSPRRSTAAWLAAVWQSGYVIERPNRPEPRGFSQVVVAQRRGARWSAADAYLRPALRRRNLRLLTEATVTPVILEGSRAVGEVVHRLGGWCRFGCDAEGFATALDDLVRILTEHTALEEKAVLPLAEKYIPAAEWEQMGRHGMDTFRKRLLPLAFGMLMCEGDPAVMRRTLSNVPLPARLLMPIIARRVYRTATPHETTA